jgi:hypothetical protein
MLTKSPWPFGPLQRISSSLPTGALAGTFTLADCAPHGVATNSGATVHARKGDVICISISIGIRRLCRSPSGANIVLNGFYASPAGAVNDAEASLAGWLRAGPL